MRETFHLSIQDQDCYERVSPQQYESKTHLGSFSAASNDNYLQV